MAASQPWDEKKFKFPGGPATALNPGFAQTFIGGTAMTIKQDERQHQRSVRDPVRGL